MSNRSMLEFNHDFHIGETDQEILEWARKMKYYLSSGDTELLPRGVTWFGMRHHTTACPMGEPPRGWDNEIHKIKYGSYSSSRRGL